MFTIFLKRQMQIFVKKPCQHNSDRSIQTNAINTKTKLCFEVSGSGFNPLLPFSTYRIHFTEEQAQTAQINNNNNRIQRCNSRLFYNLLTAPRTVSNKYTVAQAQSCVNLVQHIERLSRATCCFMCHVVRRDNSAIKFDRVCFILLAEPLD